MNGIFIVANEQTGLMYFDTHKKKLNFTIKNWTSYILLKSYLKKCILSWEDFHESHPLIVWFCSECMIKKNLYLYPSFTSDFLSLSVNMKGLYGLQVVTYESSGGLMAPSHHLLLFLPPTQSKITLTPLHQSSPQLWALSRQRHLTVLQGRSLQTQTLTLNELRTEHVLQWYPYLL